MLVNGHTNIIGIGSYMPDQIVKSEHLMAEIDSAEKFGISESFISDVVGIEERRVAAREHKPSDLAIFASRTALKHSGIDASEIDLIIFCGIERDWIEPATAHRVQQFIDAKNASCFDLSNACHGFMNGISVADAMIATGSASTALICTGEKPSNIMYEALRRLAKSDSKSDVKRWLGAFTVGDAGGAVIIRRSQHQSGFQKFNFSSNGEHTNLCYYEYDVDGRIEGQMLMKSISIEIVDFHRCMIGDTYRKLAWKPEDVDWLYCHQVGARPHRQMAELAKIDTQKAPITYRKFGNITSATIPVNFHFNPPQKGDKILILGTGSGLSISQTGMVF